MTHMKTRVTADNTIIIIITSDMEKSEKSLRPLLNITKQMHINGSSSVCSAKCKQM